MLYRLYQPEDFTAIYALEENCFRRPHRFTRRFMRQLVQSPNGATWMAVEDTGTLAGFAIVEWTASDQGMIAYIETLEVRAEDRRQGVGAELLRRLIGSASEVASVVLLLHVAEDNQPARLLYAAHGFLEQGREKNYYGRNRDALVLALSLDIAGQPHAD